MINTTGDVKSDSFSVRAGFCAWLHHGDVALYWPNATTALLFSHSAPEGRELDGVERERGGFRTHIWKRSSACGGHVTAQAELPSNVLSPRVSSLESAWSKQGDLSVKLCDIKCPNLTKRATKKQQRILLSLRF